MSVWLVRAGSHGEHEQKFVSESRVYVTWEGLDADLSKMKDKSELQDELAKGRPDTKPKAIINWVSQIWPFVHEMEKGDLVILPLKTQPAIQIGEITGDYHHHPDGPDPYFHWRPVKWIGEAIPRSHFGQDLLYTFGAFLTICRVQRNNAEARIEAMRANGWKPEHKVPVLHKQPGGGDGEPVDEDTDLEELAHDRIARVINARFKGHGLTRLVDAILRAQGYATYISPEGADGGADILAGAPPLGFGTPRLVVEVKSGDTPIDRPSIDKLLGAVSKFGAQEGLFVSWSGYRQNVKKDMAPSYFRVRLWTQTDLLEALFSVYEKLDDDIKAELPLKRIWTVVPEEESGNFMAGEGGD